MGCWCLYNDTTQDFRMGERCYKESFRVTFILHIATRYSINKTSWIYTLYTIQYIHTLLRLLFSLTTYQNPYWSYSSVTSMLMLYTKAIQICIVSKTPCSAYNYPCPFGTIVRGKTTPQNGQTVLLLLQRVPFFCACL